MSAIDIPPSLDIPSDAEIQRLDVRGLAPPEPLTKTLETLETCDGVLLQINDRAPQHLYPQLRDRGYEFETVETDESVLTAIWQS